MKELLEGFERFKDEKAENGRKTAKKPTYLAITCPTLQEDLDKLFDQPKDSFAVLKNIGAIVNEAILSSIEYVIKEYDIPNIVVIGYKNCKRIHECVKTHEIIDYDYMNLVAEPIKLAIKNAEAQEGELGANTIREIAKLSSEKIQQDSEFLAALVQAGKLQVASLYFDGDKVVELK